MTRTFLAIATAVLAATTLCAPAAQACISCNYVPEVVHSPLKKIYGARSFGRKRVVLANKERGARPAQKRVAKADTVTKTVETAKTRPVETQPESESRTISTASLLDAEPTPAKETEVASDVGCKKFFPAVGMTLTVPCE